MIISDIDFALSKEYEAKAVEIIKKLYGENTVITQSNYDERPNTERACIDIIAIPDGGKPINVQVKSRTEGCPDLCFELDKSNRNYWLRYGRADYFIYFIPDYRPEPLMFSTAILQRIFDMHYNDEDLIIIKQNRQKDNYCCYMNPEWFEGRCKDLKRYAGVRFTFGRTD